MCKYNKYDAWEINESSSVVGVALHWFCRIELHSLHLLSVSVGCDKPIPMYKWLNAVLQETQPYMINSGKMLDDMGFPDTCQRNSNYTYSSAVLQVNEGFLYTLYYGLCFSSQCDTASLDANVVPILDSLNITDKYNITSIHFFSPAQPSFTLSNLFTILFLIALTLAAFAHSIIRWVKLCLGTESHPNPSLMSKADSQQYTMVQEEEEDLTLLEKISIARKFLLLMQREDSDKIVAISVFKLLAVPLVIYGEIFWLSNHGAYNYFSFNEIYNSFYAHAATAAYYLTDCFFLISGFLFARKAFAITNPARQLLRKVIRLYPAYVIVLAIYYGLSPCFHSGPLWPIYTEQVGQCDGSWWRALLLFDNYFTASCYPFAWFVQADIQLTVLLTVLIIVYHYNKAVGSILFATSTFTALILSLVVSGPIPASLTSTLAPSNFTYFRTAYFHLFPFLGGALLSLVLANDYILDRMQQYLKVSTRVGYVHTGCGLVLGLIVTGAGVWEGAPELQAGLWRTGFVTAVAVCLAPGILSTERNNTKLHRWAAMSYPIILASGIIASSAFWGLETFQYVDGANLASFALPSILLSLALGLFIALIEPITSIFL